MGERVPVDPDHSHSPFRRSLGRRHRQSSVALARPSIAPVLMLLRPAYLRCLLLILPLAAIPLMAPRGPVEAQEADYVHSAPQLALEGRVRSVAPDYRSFDLELVITTSPSGRRTLLPVPSLRKVWLASPCYISPRGDGQRFLTPRDIPAGTVVAILGVQGKGGDLVAGQVFVGGTLPKTLPAAVPVPEIPEDPDAIILPPLRKGLAKFEPASGCYLGAFVMRDENVNGSMAAWERRVGKGHASYLRYVGYGKPFPHEWVQEVRRVGAVPNLAWEPNAGLQHVKDDAYLRKWAQAAANSGGPVFLRFASEMNGGWTAYSGNPTLYKAKFRLVARAMRKLAPNVALVWTPYCTPTGNIPDYYPGDAAVDWVGVNIYSVHHHNGRVTELAEHEDPLRFLKTVYDRYAKQKPIQISEYAATNFCLACKQSMPEFAIRKMQRMYGSLQKQFPRVKMIYWFSMDTIASRAAENNYAVTGDNDVLHAYRRITHQPHFLARLSPRLLAVGKRRSEVSLPLRSTKEASAATRRERKDP